MASTAGELTTRAQPLWQAMPPLPDDLGWTWIVTLLLTTALLTRVLTQLEPTLRSPDPRRGTRSIQRLPYWIPLLGSTLAFQYHSLPWFLSISRAYKEGVFSLNLSSRNYIIVTSPRLQAKFLDNSEINNANLVTTRPYRDRQSRLFFNNPRVETDTHTRVTRAIVSYIGDVSHSKTMTQLLEYQTYNLISSSKSWVDQAQWERYAEVELRDTSPALSVSANLADLVRHFSAHILFASILGTSFVEANPSFIGDFFAFSNKYPVFMTGLPYWITPGLGPPALAREKCLIVLDGLVNAIQASVKPSKDSGRGMGLLYDLDEVHPAIRELIKESQSQIQVKPRVTASEVLEFVWRVTFYPINLTVWTLIHLFEEGDENKVLLGQIREQLEMIVEVVKPKPTGLPFEDAPRLKFKPQEDRENACPVLVGTLLEIQRLETELDDYYLAVGDFILEGGSETSLTKVTNDATIGPPGAKYFIKKGDHIYVPFGATNKDSQFWDRPMRIVPSRYMADVGGDKRVLEAKIPQPRMWNYMHFHNDAVFLVAAILSFFDMVVLDGEGGLKHPGTTFIAGVGQPKKNIKAKVSRRVV